MNAARGRFLPWGLRTGRIPYSLRNCVQVIYAQFLNSMEGVIPASCRMEHGTVHTNQEGEYGIDFKIEQQSHRSI